MWISLGVRLFVHVAFKKTNGKIACAELDFNDTLGQGKSYLTANPNFGKAGLNKNDWMEHNRTYYEPDPDCPRVDNFRPRKELISLQINRYGEPLLPNPEIIPSGMKRRLYFQDLLRAFLAKHYGMSLYKRDNSETDHHQSYHPERPLEFRGQSLFLLLVNA